MKSKENILPATAEDTIGPYYPAGFVEESNDISRTPGLQVYPRGRPIVLEGDIRDVDGQLVVPCLVEFWQANADGRFREPGTLDDPDLDPWFSGHARQYCHDGRFRLRTIKPGAVAPEHAEATGRAPHITLTLFCDGISKVTTQIFFEDEAANADDPLLLAVPAVHRPRLIARRAGVDDGADVYRLDIIMRGEGETPFFDDVES